MENLIYFGKVSLLVTLFWLVYSFLLQKESFKNFNRWFLISGIGISFVLPFFTFTKVVEIPMIESSQFSEVIVPYASLGNREENQLRHNLDLPQMLFLMYLLGAIAMSLKLLFQLHSLRQLARKCAKQKIEGITHYFSPTPIASFSFFKGIFYHKESHDAESLHMIITHEKVHINDLHSLDLIIGNLLEVFLWFLPPAYSYRKSIVENLEFLADKKTIAQLKNIKQYQYTLLHCANTQSPQLIGNFFFSYSSLKKRIMNMNQKQSARINKLKSLVLLPLLSVFMMLFQVETIAKQIPQQNAKVTQVTYQESAEKLTDSTLSSARFTKKMEASISKTTSDEELNELSSSFKEIMDVDVKISNVKRNKKGEITKIHIKVEDKKANLVSEQKVESTNGIDPILVYRKKGKDNDILAVANEAIVQKKEGVTSKNTSSALSEIVKDKDEVYFNGKKLDVTKKNVFTTYEIEKETEKSLYLKGTFIEALDNLKEVMKLVNQEPTFYIISKSEFNKDQNISLMHVSFNSSISSNEINAYQKVSDVKVETHGNVDHFYDGPTPLSTSPIKQGNVVYLVNGKIIDDELLKEISPQSIERVEVLKNKEEIQKHTQKDVDGVVKITLKEMPSPTPPSPPSIPSAERIEVEIEGEIENLDDYILEENNIEFKAGKIQIENVKIKGLSTNESNLFFLNGKKMKDKEVDKLFQKNSEFKRVIVITDKEEIKKYTKKNIDQVILLETK